MDKNKIQDLLDKGWSVFDIADHFDVTTDSVKQCYKTSDTGKGLRAY